MKRAAHIINILILAALAALGIAMIIVQVESYPLADDENALGWIGAIFQLVMVLIMAITGIFFPANDTYLNKKQGNIVKIVLALNVFVHRTPIHMGQVDVANGKQAIHRGWEPAIGLIWMFFQAIFSCFTIVLAAGSVLAILHRSTLLLIALFIVVSFIWKVEDNKERFGEPMVKSALLPTLIALIIFAIGIAGGAIKTKLDRKDDLNLVQMKKDIEAAKELAARDYDTIEINMDEYLTAEEMIALIRSSMDTDEDIYYKLQSSTDDSDTITFIVWTEKGEDVYWYRFLSCEDGYVYYSSMKSNALTKEDVEGKEDAIL